MATNGMTGLLVTLLLASACGSTPTGSTTIAFDVTASPNPMAGALCTGCGAGSTDRAAVTTLTISETAGTAGSVTSIAMTLRDGSNTTVAQGEFDAGGVSQFTGGTNRLTAHGTLVARNVGPHYAATFAGTPGTLTYVVRVTDDTGNQV